MNHILKNKLDKCCEIAQKGIKFSPIYEKVIIYNNCDNNPQFSCFENIEGKNLKGAVICSKTIKNDKNDFGRNLEEKELFLMEDGTLKVFVRKVTISNILDGENIDVREVASDEEMSCFDYCEIVQNIEKELEKRLIRFGRINKAQTARLERLQQLKIS